MIEKLTDVPAGIDAVRAAGVLTRAEYDAVVQPLVDDAIREKRRLRVLTEIDDDYAGVTPPAMWEDLRLGLRAMGLFAACAVVTDLTWARASCRLAAFFMPCPMRVFGLDEFDEAVAWLETVSDAPRIRRRTVPETGVIVVEVDRPLRVQDIEALGQAVDDELRATSELPGLVVHAPAFPGWENLPALWRHLGLVAGHQSRIRRLAVAVDGLIPTAGASVADHVLHPTVRHFAYDEIEAAIDWAGAVTVADQVGAGT